MTRNPILSGVIVLALVGASCGGGDSDSESTSSDTDASSSTTAAPSTAEAPAPTTEAPPETTAAPETTPAPETTAAPETTTTTIPDPPIELADPDADGIVEVTVNPDSLEPLFNSFIDGDDPYYQVHTTQDELFVGVELYSVFGSAWTGELGTFPADCTTHGICIYLDPDGTGALGGGGPGAGTITVEQLDGETIVTIDSVVFTGDDGTMYRISNLTLGG